MSSFIKDFLAGSVAFTLCAMSYCAFWATSYNDHSDFPMAVKSVLFFATAILGVAAIAFFAAGIKNSNYTRGAISNLMIVAASVIIYVLLAIITKNAFKRIVTTELILITFCTMGALCILNSLYRVAIFSSAISITLVIFTAMIFIASLFCYMVYYKLDAQKAFIVGFIPLALYAMLTIMTFIAILISNHYFSVTSS